MVGLRISLDEMIRQVALDLLSWCDSFLFVLYAFGVFTMAFHWLTSILYHLYTRYINTYHLSSFQNIY